MQGEQQRQFLQEVQPAGVTGVERHVREGGGGHERASADDVVVQPGLVRVRQVAGAEQAAGVREAGRRGQHRMADGGPGRARCGLRRLGQPVAFPLEGVGGQVHPPGTSAWVPPVHGFPVDRRAVHVQPGECRQDRAGLRSARPDRRGEDQVPGLLDGGHRGRDELCAGAHLDEGGHPRLTHQMSYDVREPHRCTGMADPVGRRAQIVSVGPAPGHGRDDRDAGLTIGGARRRTAELRERRFDQRRVERVAGPQSYGAPPPGLEACGHRQHRLLGPGDDDRPWGVHRRDRHRPGLLGPFRQRRPGLFFGGVQRHHGAACRELLHQSPSGGDQFDGVPFREDSGDVRRGQLADGVAGQDVRSYPPRCEQPEQGDLESEQAGLCDVGTALRSSGRRVRRGPQGLAQGPVPDADGVEPVAQGLEGVGEDGVREVQLPAQARPAGSLTGEEQRQPPARPDRGRHDGRRLGGEPVQVAQQGCAVLDGHRGPVAERRAGGRQRERHVLEGKFGPFTQEPRQAPCLGPQCLGAPAGQQQRRLGSAVGGPVVGFLLHGDRFFEDHVGVGSPDAEGGHGGAAGASGCGAPRLLPGEQPYGARGPVHAR